MFNRLPRFLAFGCVAVMLMIGVVHAQGQEGPVAHTRYGDVRGYDDGPVKVFKGIPYGANTGGQNRWLPPKPPAAWKGVKDTKVPGPESPQRFGAPLAEETALLQKGPMSEDCLNLNVYTPRVGSNSGKRAVMVWFHGGGFVAGSGNAATYDGRNLAENHDVVLVTVTHRLSVFGFLYLGGLDSRYLQSGDVGLLDLIASLKWVKENIANFGGDPDNVTIFGQSGGGFKVTALMAMPGAKGLFKHAIAQSGAIIRGLSKAQASENAAHLMMALDVKTLEQLQGVTQERLVQAMGEVHFQPFPVVDGAVLPNDPFYPGAPVISRDVPLMVGTTETESTFFPPAPLDAIDEAELHKIIKNATKASDTDTDKLIATFAKAYPGKDSTYLAQLILSQTTFQVPTTQVAERKADQGGAPVYVYYFTKASPVREGKLRATHTIEIPYAFDSLAKASPIIGPLSDAQQALADKVSAAWVSFAKTGNPNNPMIPIWPPFNTKSRAIMIINDVWAVANDPLHDTRLAVAELQNTYPSSF